MTPTADPSERARHLWLEANEAAQQGRLLIEESIQLRRAAFDALPQGVVLAFDFPPACHQEFYVTLGPNGWAGARQNQDTHPSVDTAWVLEQWERSNWTITSEEEPAK